MGPLERLFAFNYIVCEATALVLAPHVLLGCPQFETVKCLFGFVVVHRRALLLLLLLKDLLNERFSSNLDFGLAETSHAEWLLKDGLGDVGHVMFGH